MDLEMRLMDLCLSRSQVRKGMISFSSSVVVTIRQSMSSHIQGS